jgi:hypothetical protein
LEVIDSRFLAEYFFSDDQEIKSKATKHLTDLIKKRKGILPTIVITKIVRYVCVGQQSAALCADGRMRMVESSILYLLSSLWPSCNPPPQTWLKR